MHLPAQSTVPATPIPGDVASVTERAVWSAGDPEAVYAEFLPLAEELATWAGIGPDSKVLAIDLPVTAGPAQSRSPHVHVHDWRTASADALPYADGAFDAVVSTFGLVLAPNAAKAGAEIGRVLRPGGVAAFSTWHADGTMGRLFTVLRRYAPQVPGPERPLAWGRAADIKRHIGPALQRAEVQIGNVPHRGTSIEASWDFFRKSYGPIVRAVESSIGQRKEALTEEVKAIIKMGFRSDIGLIWNREFIMVRATRG